MKIPLKMRGDDMKKKVYTVAALTMVMAMMTACGKKADMTDDRYFE